MDNFKLVIPDIDYDLKDMNFSSKELFIESFIEYIKLKEKRFQLSHYNSKFHEESLFQHVNFMLEKLFLFEDELSDREMELLKILILFHDVGKLYTETLVNGYPSYRGHGIVSSHIFREFTRNNEQMKKLFNLDDKIIYIFSYIIRNHFMITKMKETKRMIVMNNLGKYSKLLTYLIIVDRLGRISNDIKDEKEEIKNLKEKFKYNDNELDVQINWKFDYNDLVSYINNNDKVFISFVGTQGVGKTTMRNKIIEQLNTDKHIFVFNFDELRENGIDISKGYYEKLREIEENYVIILDVTNINEKHIRRNRIFEIVKKSDKSIFVNLDNRKFHLGRRNDRINIPLDVLVFYDGMFTPSWLYSELRNNEVVHFHIYKKGGSII